MAIVVPYSETKGSKKFKEFLSKPFTVDMLYPVFGDKSVETLFDGWRSSGVLNGWSKFTSENYTLEFYPTYYTIKKNKPANSTGYMLALPKDIDDFIADMKRFGVELQWTNWIDENFEPKEYLRVEDIKEYWRDLLANMGKSHELL